MVTVNSMNDTSITVVCPVWQSAAYIDKTADMLLQQTQLPQEVIFIDDGSTDGSAKVLESRANNFTDKGIKFILVRSAHMGPGHARNVGIMQASMRWIAFLDADDIWLPSKLQQVSAAIVANPSCNCFTHWESYRRINGQVEIIYSGTAYDPTVPLPRQVYAANHFSTSATVLLAELVRHSGGMDPSLPASQDYELWLRLSPQLRLCCLSEVLGEYVELPCSITARPYWKRVGPLLRILWRHRAKGGLRLAGLRMAKALLSRQWLHSIRNLLFQRRGH